MKLSLLLPVLNIFITMLYRSCHRIAWLTWAKMFLAIAFSIFSLFQRKISLGPTIDSVAKFVGYFVQTIRVIRTLVHLVTCYILTVHLVGHNWIIILGIFYMLDFGTFPPNSVCRRFLRLCFCGRCRNLQFMITTNDYWFYINWFLRLHLISYPIWSE